MLNLNTQINLSSYKKPEELTIQGPLDIISNQNRLINLLYQKYNPNFTPTKSTKLSKNPFNFFGRNSTGINYTLNPATFMMALATNNKLDPNSLKKLPSTNVPNKIDTTSFTLEELAAYNGWHDFFKSNGDNNKNNFSNLILYAIKGSKTETSFGEHDKVIEHCINNGATVTTKMIQKTETSSDKCYKRVLNGYVNQSQRTNNSSLIGSDSDSDDDNDYDDGTNQATEAIKDSICSMIEKESYINKIQYASTLLTKEERTELFNKTIKYKINDLSDKFYGKLCKIFNTDDGNKSIKATPQTCNICKQNNTATSSEALCNNGHFHCKHCAKMTENAMVIGKIDENTFNINSMCYECSFGKVFQCEGKKLPEMNTSGFLSFIQHNSQ